VKRNRQLIIPEYPLLQMKSSANSWPWRTLS